MLFIYLNKFNIYYLLEVLLKPEYTVPISSLSQLLQISTYTAKLNVSKISSSWKYTRTSRKLTLHIFSLRR